MKEDQIPLLRKAVEWVEMQDGLPAILREWEQDTWVFPKQAVLESDLDGLVHESNYKDEAVLVHPDKRAFVEEYGVTPEEARNLLETGHVCGTAYCFAGRVASWLDERYLQDSVVDGVHCGEFVRESLGLTQEEASSLYYCENNAEKIRELAEKIAGTRL